MRARPSVTSLAAGRLDTTSKAFDLQARAEGVQLDKLFALSGQRGAPNVTGTADFNAHVSGSFSDTDFSAYQITFDGQEKTFVISGPRGRHARARWRDREQAVQTSRDGRGRRAPPRHYGVFLACEPVSVSRDDCPGAARCAPSALAEVSSKPVNNPRVAGQAVELSNRLRSRSRDIEQSIGAAIHLR